jgi:hypothetical protein
MPTTKHRVNLSVSSDLKQALQKLARRDRTSVAAKTLDLVNKALEIEEDAALLDLAKKRQKTKGTFVAHERAWV